MYFQASNRLLWYYQILESSARVSFTGFRFPVPPLLIKLSIPNMQAARSKVSLQSWLSSLEVLRLGNTIKAHTYSPLTHGGDNRIIKYAVLNRKLAINSFKPNRYNIRRSRSEPIAWLLI